MATEPILDAHPKLEVGEVIQRTFVPGVTPPPPAVNRISTKNSELLEWIKREVKHAEKHVLPWQDAARKCYKFVAGDQYSDEDRRILRINQRPDNAFNSLQKFVRYMSGIERRSPQALLFNPTVIDSVDQQILGDFLTNTFEWAQGKNMARYNRSRMFEDLCITGMAWSDAYIDRLRDPRGLIKQPRISVFEALWPDCEDDNLNSTRWRARESLVDRDDAIRRWPEHELLFKSIAGSSGTDGGFPEEEVTKYTIPYIETIPVGKSEAKPDKHGKVKVLQFQWYEDMEGWTFNDPVSGEPVWMSADDFRKYRRRIEVIQRGLLFQLRPEKSFHRVMRQVHVLERRELLEEPSRLPGDRFTLNCMTASFDQALRQWYGYVRVMMDPQRYANKFFNQIIEIVGTNAKSGYFYEQDAFVDSAGQHDFEDTVARPGSNNKLASGALKEGKIQAKKPGEIPASTMAVLEFCISSQERVTGLNTSGLSSDDGGGQQPALTMRQKQQVGTVLLAKEFDALSRYRIEDEGPVVFSLLSLIADGRLVRVGGEGAQKVIPLLRQPFLLEYDLMLDETEHDPNVRTMYSNWIVQAGPMLAKQGLFVPEMLNYMPFPVKIRQLMIQQMKAQAQQQQEMAAKGINIRGRGTPKDPREVQAKIEKLQSDAVMHRARAQSLLSESKREDLRTVIDAIQGVAQHGLDREQHTLEQRRYGLERERHHAERARGFVQDAVQILQALQQTPVPSGGGGE